MIFNHKNEKDVFQSLKISRRFMTIFWNHDLTGDIALLIE